MLERLQKLEIPRIFRQSGHESGMVVSPTHRLPLTAHEIFLVLFYYRLRRLQGRIEFETFRLVAQGQFIHKVVQL